MKKELGFILSSLMSTSFSYANLPVFTKSEIFSENKFEDSFVGEFEMVPELADKSRAEMIKDAALAASASYSDTRAVQVKSTPIRGNTEEQRNANNLKGIEYREAMIANGEQLVTFSATIKENMFGNLFTTGQVPAGIISLLVPTDGSRARLTVAFHGTESKDDLLTDANAIRQNTALLSSQQGWASYLPFLSSTVHGGFNNRYMQAREAMFDAIEGLLMVHDLSLGDVDILVTGHSLGAALATLAAVDIAALKRDSQMSSKGKIFLVVFSSPPVANDRGAREIETLLGKNHIIRVWRKLDPIVFDAFGLVGYSHVGTSVMLKANSQGNFFSMENHKMSSILDDAQREEGVEFVVVEETTTTYFERAKNFISSISSFKLW